MVVVVVGRGFVGGEGDSGWDLSLAE